MKNLFKSVISGFVLGLFIFAIFGLGIGLLTTVESLSITLVSVVVILVLLIVEHKNEI